MGVLPSYMVDEMSSYERVFQHVHKSQNAFSLERAKREIEEMMNGKR